jgi:tetratricopeptide (TPR) repeat protein
MIIRLFFVALCLSLPLHAGPADALIQQGDAFAAKWQTMQALESYKSAQMLEPQNAHILVCIAREYRHLLGDATQVDEKLRLGGIALDYSLRAAALAPNDSEAQLAPAITYGKMLPFQSGKLQFSGSQRIKESADKALKLDPKNDIAWHILGRWHRALADISMLKRLFAPLVYGKLPTSTNEEAVICFERAIKINPGRLMHSIELGHTYVQMGRGTDARKWINKGLALPNVDKDDPTTKQLGRDLLTKLP